MRTYQLEEIIPKLDRNKRWKFQNFHGWGDDTMAINGIIERGEIYIFCWVCHPKLIKDDMIEGDRLIWYNPNSNAYGEIKKYFPEYKELINV